MNIKKIFIIILALLTVVTFSKNVFRRLADNTERQIEFIIGFVSNLSVEASSHIIRSGPDYERLQKVAKNLLPYVKRKRIKYRFAIIKADYINAFAIPGGYIYVTSKLMKVLDDDSELACVLGHELGHIQAKHSVRALERSYVFQAILNYYRKKSSKVKKNTELIQIANYIFNDLRYSRANEREADRYGIDFAIKAGYDPYGMIRFFKKLEKLEGKDKGIKWLRTHPLTSERIKLAGEYIKKRLQQQR